MGAREWQVGIVGTFDVENYGDLLFPLIAKAELAERLGRVKLHRFSYRSKTADGWPYPVTSVTELPRVAADLDGLLIGGGFLLRFDKEIARDYGPPVEAIHHPTGYWLTPALIALQHDVPVIWNAPGSHCNDVPAWADPLMRLALSRSAYVAVRDAPSRATLARFAAPDRITVVPDTGFGLARLFDEHPSPELDHLRKTAGLTLPYVVIQPTRFWEPFYGFLRDHAELLRDVQILALPIGPVLGDDAEIPDSDLPGLIRLPFWPQPLLVAELIRHAIAAVGHSYHLAITALTAGVPIFTPVDMTAGKYSALTRFESIYPLPGNQRPDPAWFASRLGRVTPSLLVGAALDELSVHWDRIAAALRARPACTHVSVGQFWQSLPRSLEVAAHARDEAVEAGQRQHQAIAALERLLSDRQERVASLELQLSDHQERITSLELQLSDHQERITSLSAECSSREERIGEVNESLALARSRLEVGAATWHAQSHAISALETRLRGSQANAQKLARALTQAQADIAFRDDQLATLLTSSSWQVTAPLRFAGRWVRRLRQGECVCST